jgi:hypothetical protein
VLARWPLWLAALWWGSLSTLGFMVVPLLFVYLPTPALAGAMAAKLFAAQTWVSVLCAALLLLVLKIKQNTPLSHDGCARPATFFIVTGLLLALLSEFLVAPKIVAKDNLRFWHTAGSAMYLLQWGCAAMTFATVTRAGQNKVRPEVN